mgnify:CR=1 FL=1
MKKFVLMTSAAAMAFAGLTAGAQAQAGSAPEPGAATQSTSDVITVTARKREESLQQVPVSVTAFSGDFLVENDVRDLEEIALLTPGLQLQSEFGRGGDRPIIRGQANILGDSGVAYFIDGAYISGSLQAFDLSDIERVEIIKGPQSALYGRNTYSGAIAYYTREPGDEASGRVEVSVGEDEFVEINGSVSGALVEDRLWASANVQYYDYGGAFTNANGGGAIGEENTVSVSTRLQWRATESVEFDLRLARSQSEDGQPAQFAQSSSENNCFEDDGSLYQGLGRYFCGTITPGVTSMNTDDGVQFITPPGRDLDRTQAILNTSIELGQGYTFESITGYTWEEGRFASDSDFTANAFQVSLFTPGGFPLGFPFPAPFGFVTAPTDFSFEEETLSGDFTQEFRLSNSVNNRIRWEVGGFYYFNHAKNTGVRETPATAPSTLAANFAAVQGQVGATCAANPLCLFPIFVSGPPAVPVPANTTSRSTITNLAAFGLVEVDLTDRLAVSLEGRYADESLSFESASTPGEVNTSYGTFTPRVTVDYQATDSLLVYASYSEGTKPGGFNAPVYRDLEDARLQAATGVTPAERAAAQAFIASNEGFRTFDEEDVVAYEVGFKSELLQDQLRFNVAAFMNEISGYQLTSGIANLAQTNTISITSNAGDAEILGAEILLDWTPDTLPGFTASLGYAWTDSEFTDGVDQNQGVLNDVADDGLVNCSTGDQFPAVADCQSLFGSIVGKRIPRSSEHQLTLQAGYTAALTSTWDWFVRGVASYESERYVQVHNLADTGDATTVNLNFGVENDQYSIRVWGKNVTDEDAVLAAVRYADSNAAFRRNFFGTLRDPAQWGVSLAARF